jgi:lipid A ethanolaminephosphotransferase
MAKRKRLRTARVAPLRDAPRNGPALAWGPRLVQLLGQRPQVSVELLAFLASLFFVVASNRAFWQATRDTGAFEGANGWGVAVAVFILLVCVHTALLYVVLLRATTKVVLMLLFVAAAVISHASTANGAYLEPESMRRVLQANLLTSSAPGSWAFAWTLTTQAGLPVLLLWRVQLARFSLPFAFARRAVAMVLVCAFATLAMALPQQELRQLMQEQRALRYLVTPANLLAVVALRMSGGEQTQPPADHTIVPTPPPRVLKPKDAPLPPRRERL